MSHDQDSGDRALGMERAITRRDFLNGVAIGVGGAMAARIGSVPGLEATLAAAAFAQDAPGYYPPALTGMRGSHDGSYDGAHALRDGTFWARAGEPIDTGESYDLVVVGAGISGLAAAHFYRAQTSPSARILVLDNHDDFGGHARRNEFRLDGRLWIANGGTVAIESPFPYSAEARGLMSALGIDPEALSETSRTAADRSVFKNLRPSIFFDRETFGTDRLVVGSPGAGRSGAAATEADWRQFLWKTPLAPD